MDRPPDFDIAAESGTQEVLVAGRTLLAARAYTRKGWKTIPVPRGSKNPGFKGWEKLELTEPDLPAHFGNGSNIGILLGEPSGGLVDVDLDAEEALILALEFLPPTALIHGRPGKPQSHRWYQTTSPPRTIRVEDPVGGASIVEFRSTGGQTIVPPSRHPNGEILAWTQEGEPADVDCEDLIRCVKRLGAAALLARHWPGPGSRDKVAMALAGMLLRGGVALAEAEHFILVVARAAGDEEAPARARTALETAEKIAAGSRATGAAALAQAVGEKVVAKVREWVGLGRSPQGAASATRGGGTAGNSNEGCDRRPTIVVRGELVPVCDEAEDALVHDAASPLYTRARMLVRVVQDARPHVPGLRRAPGTPHIEVVGVDHLRERLDRAARWIVLKSNGPIVEECPVLPPTWVATVLAARGEWPFPPLDGVIEAPAIRLDGSILDEPGYDAASGLLYLPSIEFPPVPESPTMDDARVAAGRLLDPLIDFPFVGDSDRAAAIAAVLTLAGRDAIAGPVPCFGVRAPTPGTGKSLLVDVISITTTGRVAARMTVPRDDDEGRKRILSIGLEGAPIVLLDNVEGALGSPSLAAALTGTEFADRLLGVSKIVRVPMRTTWFCTGNGLTFRGDLGRRVVPIDLDPKVEHPEDRLGFKYPDLLPHVRRERPDLLVAALTVLRAFDQAGRPGHGQPKVGTFEEWDDLIRGAVMWLGLDDPVSGRQRVREEGDADLDTIRAVYLSWHDAFGDGARTVAEAIAAATNEAESRPDLRAALAALDPRGDGSRLNSRVVADRLKRWKGRVVAGLQLETAGKHHQAKLWRVVPPGSPDAGPGASGEGDPGSHTSEGSHFPADPVLNWAQSGESREFWESDAGRLDCNLPHCSAMECHAEQRLRVLEWQAEERGFGRGGDRLGCVTCGDLSLCVWQQ